MSRLASHSCFPCFHILMRYPRLESRDPSLWKCPRRPMKAVLMALPLSITSEYMVDFCSKTNKQIKTLSFLMCYNVCFPNHSLHISKTGNKSVNRPSTPFLWGSLKSPIRSPMCMWPGALVSTKSRATRHPPETVFKVITEATEKCNQRRNALKKLFRKYYKACALERFQPW